MVLGLNASFFKSVFICVNLRINRVLWMTSWIFMRQLSADGRRFPQIFGKHIRVSLNLCSSA